MAKDVHYGDYLQLEKILHAQDLESDLLGAHAHDEMLFIVIHQTYELWFKQLLFETGSVIEVMRQPLNDNSPELQTVVHRLSRCTTILKVLVHQIDIMETMTPMDFLDFRDMLRPASGFQSWQFKLLEARLGLKYEHRYGQQYYTSQLRQPEVDTIKAGEKELSLLQLVNNWLERMPFFQLPADAVPAGDPSSTAEATVFWTDYRARYQQSLADSEKANLALFDKLFFHTPEVPPGDTAHPGDAPPKRSLSPAACRAALFIMLYRGYPMLQLPFQVLNQLLEIDEQLSTWRYRHMSMVHRMIGTRIGTGGSTGKDYLGAALASHHLFKEVAGLTSFLIERRRLPQLGPEMERRLGFARND